MKCWTSILAVGSLLCHFVNFIISFEKIPYSLVEARRKNVLAHAARFCRAGTRIKYASSFLRFRISLVLNSEPSKPHMLKRGRVMRRFGGILHRIAEFPTNSARLPPLRLPTSKSIGI